MFKFVTRFFKKEKVTLQEVKVPRIEPKKILPDSASLSDSGITRHEGHVDFGKTKSITRKFKKVKIRESLEERREVFYDERGNLFDR